MLESRQQWKLTLAILLLSAAFAPAASAAPAVAYSGTVIAGTELGVPGSVRGWVFDVLPGAGILVTDLGVYDRNADGLGEAHDVGIWNSGGAMVASGTVPSGVAASLDANSLFRLVDIADVVLPQASGYVIGAYYSNQVDGFDSQVSGLVTHPSIAYAGKRFELDVASLQLPTTPFQQQPGYFGPSFEIGVIPEPSSLALAACGGLGALLFLARGRKRRAVRPGS